MSTEQALRKKIMRRVYVVYWTRMLLQPKVRFAAALVIVLGIASSVSMPHIIANALHSSDLVGFSVSAVSHTTMFVQLGILLAGLILVSMFVDAVRPRFAGGSLA